MLHTRRLALAYLAIASVVLTSGPAAAQGLDDSPGSANCFDEDSCANEHLLPDEQDPYDEPPPIPSPSQSYGVTGTQSYGPWLITKYPDKTEYFNQATGQTITTHLP